MLEELIRSHLVNKHIEQLTIQRHAYEFQSTEQLELNQEVFFMQIIFKISNLTLCY